MNQEPGSDPDQVLKHVYKSPTKIFFQMNGIYVIQDKTGYVWAATYEEEKAIEICRPCQGKEKEGSTYRAIPFYSCEGTEITVIAGPIPKEYLPK